MLKLLKITNYKPLLTTSLGVGTAQIIAFISVPFIARMSGPELFGEYGLYNSLALVLCVFASLKLEFALFTIPWRLYPYLKLLVSWLLPISSLLLGVGTVVFWGHGEQALILQLLNISQLIFSICIFEFIAQDNIKQGRFKANAFMRVIRAVSVPVIFMILFELFGISVEIIIISFSVANIASILFVSRTTYKNPKILFQKNTLKKLFKSCRRVTLYLVPGHFLMRYSSGAVVLLSSSMGYQLADIAKFVIIEKLVIAPISIATTAISDVVKREVLLYPRKGLENFYKLAFYAIILSGIAVLIFILFSEQLIILIMGEQWQGIGPYAVAMLPYFVAVLVLSPITHTYTVLNKQNYDFMWQIFHAITITTALYIGLSDSLLSGVWFFSVAAAFSLFISFLICRTIILRHPDTAERAI